MLAEVPNIKENIKVIYEDIRDERIMKKFGDHTPPVIIINDSIYLEGHVPVIKKLSKKILEELRA
jgi:hypothetical protein